MLEILGPLGLVLVFTAIMKISRQNGKFAIIHLAIIPIAALIIIAPFQHNLSFFIFALALYSFSLWGLDHFLKSVRLTVLLMALLIMTFWYFSFSWQMPTICNEIFFN